MSASATVPRVAIIGGGLSGLTTAVHLHRLDPSIPLTLFEAQQRVGGVIDTDRVGELVIDHGADMFATQPAAAIDLCHDLGVADRLIEPKVEGRGAMIVCRGRLVPVPDGFVLMRATKLWPMLTTPLLSIRGKLRLLVEPLIPSRQRDEDESVAAFVRRRLGREVLDRIVAPLVAGIYTADVERLSMRATMGPIFEMESRYGSLTKATLARRLSREDSLERTSSGARYGQFRAFRGGMIELIQTLRDALPDGSVRTGQKVVALQRSAGGWDVGLADGKRETFDRVVVATPSAAAARLLRPLAPVAAETLDSIESASTAIVVLAVPRTSIQRPVATFGFVVPPIEKRKILAVSFASEKFDGRAPHDQVILRVFIGGALQPDLLSLTDDQLIEIARQELADLIGLSDSVGATDPATAWVVRWDQAMPQYHVGHLEKVQRIRDQIESLPGLSLTGNGLDGVGIAPLIAAARRVAERIVSDTGAIAGEADSELGSRKGPSGVSRS